MQNRDAPADDFASAMVVTKRAPTEAEMADLKRSLGMLKARKFEHKKAAGPAPVRGEAEKRSAVVPILMMLVLLPARARPVPVQRRGQLRRVDGGAVNPGTYTFICLVHGPEMSSSIVIQPA